MASEDPLASFALVSLIFWHFGLAVVEVLMHPVATMSIQNLQTNSTLVTYARFSLVHRRDEMMTKAFLLHTVFTPRVENYFLHVRISLFPWCSQFPIVDSTHMVGQCVVPLEVFGAKLTLMGPFLVVGELMSFQSAARTERPRTHQTFDG